MRPFAVNNRYRCTQSAHRVEADASTRRRAKCSGRAGPLKSPKRADCEQMQRTIGNGQQSLIGANSSCDESRRAQEVRRQLHTSPTAASNSDQRRAHGAACGEFGLGQPAIAEWEAGSGANWSRRCLSRLKHKERANPTHNSQSYLSRPRA